MDARTRWLTFLVALLAALSGLRAQDGTLTLDASFDPPTAKAGDPVKLVLTGTVSEGWHAYGTKEETNIPVSLPKDKLVLSGLEAAGEPAIPTGTPTAGPGGTQYPLPHVFVVTVPLRVPAGQAAGAIEVKGEFGFQICDANMCLPPDTVKFAAKLAVAAGKPAPQAQQPVAPLPPLKLRAGEKVAVRASFEPAQAKVGDTVTLAIDVLVDERYHAYGIKETTNIPVAVDLAKAKLGGLEAVGSPLVPDGEPAEKFGMTQYPLPHTFRVTQQLRVPAGTAGAIAVGGVLDYQVCDESSCEPPAEATFAATLQVGGVGDVAKPGLKLDADARVQVKASFEPATIKAGETATLVLDVKVAEHYHAYGSREPVNVPVSLDTKKLALGKLELVGDPVVPPGTAREGIVGTAYPLPQTFRVTQQVRAPADFAAGDVAVSGELRYQVCNDQFQCEPADKVTFATKLVVEKGKGGSSAAVVPASAPGADGKGGDGEGGLGTLWGLILACIGGGLFALAMPCTYPMIPITFSFFTKQAEKRGGNVLSLALAYGFGIVAMFVLVGTLMSNIIILVVNHWATNAVIGAAFVFFACVLFGWINLNPPQFVQRAAGKASKTGGLLGVFFMGATLVITSFTCTAPIVGSLIANVAQYGTAKVALGMAVFGLTMAIPFVFLSLAPSKVKALPRSGEWMDTLKISLGFVELAAALKFVSMVDFALGWQIMPRELFLMLWTAIFAMWALFLFGILRKAGTPNEGVSAGRMASGMVVSLLAAYFLFGALGNRLDSIMTGFIPGYSNSLVARGEGHKDKYEHVVVYDDSVRAMTMAKAEDKLLLYNFTGFN